LAAQIPTTLLAMLATISTKKGVEAVANIQFHFDQLLGLSLQSHDLSIWQVCLRAVFVFFILLAIVRVGKKHFLGEAAALDATLVIMIGSTASRAIRGNAPFGSSLAATATLVACALDCCAGHQASNVSEPFG
jgi:hypothetical protein